MKATSGVLETLKHDFLFTIQKGTLSFGTHVVKLLQSASRKLAPTKQASGGMTVAATIITIFAIYRVSNFFYDVGKHDFRDGKVIKGIAELAVSLATFALAISTATALIFALFRGLSSA